MLVWTGCSGKDLPLAPGGTRTKTSLQRASYRIADPYMIELTGNDFRWQVRYPHPGGDSETSPTLALRDVHAPFQTTLVLVLKSLDYV